MADLMKKAIRQTFMEMLEEVPLNKITVKELTNKCGINRNSFYYHYQDIPQLIEEIVKTECDEAIKRYPTLDSLEECISLATEFSIAKRREVLHIYNSVNRDIFERYLWEMCDYGITQYINSLLKDKDIDEGDKVILIRYHKCECFGIIIDWLDSGMQENIMESYKRILEIKKDQLYLSIERLEKSAE